MGYQSHDDKIKIVQDELDSAKEAARQSLIKVVERGDRLESISVTAENLQIEAGLFKKNARKTHMHFCIQQWKMIALCVCILAVLGLSLGLWSLNIGGSDATDDVLNGNNNMNDNAHLNDA